MQKERADEGGDANDDLASRLIHALNHPTRRRILKTLTREPTSATMLADAFGLKLGVIAYHLCKVLFEECAVIEVVQRNKRRGAVEKVFALKSEAFVGAIDWPTLPGPMRSGLRGLALCDFQDAALASLEAENERPNDSSIYLYQPVSVDDGGRREIARAAREFADKVKAVEERCAGIDAAELLQFIVATAFFEAAPPSEAGNRRPLDQSSDQVG